MAKDEKNTILIDDVEYDLDSFTDQLKALCNHINDLDRKLGNAQFNIDQLNVGRRAFFDMLVASLTEEKSED